MRANMKNYQLAEINIARMKGVNIDDPIMREFVENLDKINALAENSEGFVWRLKDENNNAASLNPYQDERIIVNISVWKTIESLKNFAYRTFHAEIFKRRSEWFQKFGKAYMTMWWISEGEFPTLEQAVDKLSYFQKHGASETAFDFKTIFPPPAELKKTRGKSNAE
jgi:Domain of unknown function (DUF3291)